MFTFSIGYNLQIDWSKFYERISLLLMDPVYFVKHDAFGFKSITGTDMFESIHNFRFATGIFLMSKLICWKSENNLWKETFLWVQIHPTLILVLWLLVYNVSIKQVVIDLTKIWRKYFFLFYQCHLLTNLSPYFSQSSFICVKSRTVVPHKVAVFSTNTTLPLSSENLNSDPLSLLADRS